MEPTLGLVFGGVTTIAIAVVLIFVVAIGSSFYE